MRDDNRLFRNGFITYLMQLGIVTEGCQEYKSLDESGTAPSADPARKEGPGEGPVPGTPVKRSK